MPLPSQFIRLVQRFSTCGPVLSRKNLFSFLSFKM